MEKSYDLGLLLKELRVKAGLSQQELGDKINRDKGIISRYENNYQTPPFETIRDFAAIFNVSVDYLAGMEKHGKLSLHGLTDVQADMLSALAQLFREKNSSASGCMTPHQCEVIGRIVADLSAK